MLNLDILNDSIDSFGKRLQKVVDLVGSTAELSRRTSIAPSTIKAYIDEVNDPTRKKLIEICQAADVSIEWLATGKGPMTTPLGKKQVNNREESDPLFRELKLWLKEMSSDIPGWRTWFEIELIRKIPEFKEWREKHKQSNPKNV